MSATRFSNLAFDPETPRPNVKASARQQPRAQKDLQLIPRATVNDAKTAPVARNN
jgi:hypothetical protein